MPTVQIEGFGKVAFPDQMSPDEIRNVIETEIIPKGSAAREQGRGMQDAIRGKDDSFLSDLKAHAASAGLSALNGLTFGFGDEIAGALAGAADPANFSQRYQQGRDYVRGANEQYRKDSPIAATATDVAGGVLNVPAGVVGAVGKMGALGRAGVSAGIGGGLGALSGAGAAESLADVPGSMLTGGALGAATGGVLTGAGAVAGAVGRNIAPRIPENWGGAGAANAALRRLGYVLERDDMTGQQVIRRMQKLGPEATIADAGGANLRNELDTMATLPGRTANSLERLQRQRTVTRGDRLEAIPDALSGGHKGDDILAMLQTTKEELSAPLYAKVDQVAVPVTPALAELADRPIIKAAIEQARTNVANQGKEFADQFVNTSLAKGTTPLRFWDDVKKGLDDVIGGIKRGTSNTKDGTLRSALQVKNELLAELDKLAPVYREARDAFAGPAALQSAIEDGRNALNMKPAEIERTLFNLGESEREAFRLGAADAMREKIGTRAGQTNLLNAPIEKNTRMLLKSIFGDQEGYRNAMKTILAEGQLKRLENVGKNSKTASREAAIEDLNFGVLEDAANAAKSAAGGSVSGVVRAARSLGGRLQTPEVVRDEIGNILMLKMGQKLHAKPGDPSAGIAPEQLANLIDQVVESVRRGNSQAAAIQGVLGGTLINP